MGVVASWGSYSWSVAPDTIKTFYDYTRKTAYKTEKVEDGKNKPGTTRVAPELTEIKFSVILSMDLGVNPSAELNALRDACEGGEPQTLLFGNVPASKHRFLLKNVSEKDAAWGPDGQMLAVSADLDFEEYVKEKAKPPASTETAGGGGGSSGTKKKASAPPPPTPPKVFVGGGGVNKLVKY